MGSFRSSVAILVLVIAVAYANALGTGLPLDAGALVLGNPALRALSLENLRTILTSDYWWPNATNGLFRPVTTLSFLANWTLLGNADRPLGYHVVNVVLHMTCAAAALSLFGRVGLGRRPALLAAVLFALHPATTEVVTNVAGRADLIGALAVLAGLLCHANSLAAVGWRRAAWAAALVATALVGVFGKENAVVLVALVVAWDAAFVTTQSASPRQRLRILCRGPLLLAPVVVLMLVARSAIQSHGWPVETSPLDNPILDAGFWSGRLTAVKVLGLQLATAIAPLWLSADYSYDQIPLASTGDWHAVLALVVLAALSAATLRAWRTDRTLGFLAVFALLTLLPTANLIVVIGSIRADRFLYLPLVGMTGALVRLAWLRAPDDAVGLRRHRQVVTGTVCALAVLYGLRTALRNPDWTSELTLWTATVASSPRSAKARNGHAEALVARGEPGDLEQAIAEGERAIAIRADYLPALANLGGWYLMRGDVIGGAGARQWYRRALAVLGRARVVDRQAAIQFRHAMRARGERSTNIPDYGNRALAQQLVVAHARLGHWRGVLAASRRRQQLDPWDRGTYVDMAAALANLGRWDDAAVCLLQALVLGSDPTVEGRLVEAYRRLDAGASALHDEAPGRVRLDLDHPLVRSHRCRALDGLGAVFADAALPDVASRLRLQAAAVCGRNASAHPTVVGTIVEG